MLAVRILQLSTLTAYSAVANACEFSPDPCAHKSGDSYWGLVLVATVFGLYYGWRWWTTPTGVAFDKDDPEKLAAEDEARATLPLFWAAYANPAPDEVEFGLKFNLSLERDAEFIWAGDIERRDGCIFGRLANEPWNPAYRIDDNVEIDPALIVDWTYFKGNVAQGHFMTRAMFKHMPARHVRQGKKHLGWS